MDFAASGCDVAGVEIAEELVAAYRDLGFDVRAMEDGEVLPFEDQRFDVVYLMQVIEHVRRPERLFAELSRVTRPDGSVYMACPNGLSPWRRLFGASWVSGWFAPFHLFVYSVPVLAALGERHGLTLVRAWSRTPESWLRLNVLAAARPADGRVERVQTSAIDRLLGKPARMLIGRIADVLTGQGDCLVAEFRKGRARVRGDA
jgi:SAM-dependent methyltransferase